MTRSSSKRLPNCGRPTRLRPTVESLERRDLLASFTTPEDTPLVVPDSGLVGATTLTAPAHGTVEFSAAGFKYSPTPDFNGADSFVYRRVDDASTAVGTTISLDVTPVNDPPVPYPRGVYVLQGNSVNVSVMDGLLPRADMDIDLDPVEAVLVSNPAHGTLTLRPDGSYTYQSDANFWGVDHFVYRLSDGHAPSDVSQATVSISVAPTNVPQALDEYDTIQQDEVLRPDSPRIMPPDWALALGFTTTLEQLPAHGTVVLAPDGKFIYTPDAGFNGAVQFTYKINDPAASTYPQLPSDATESDKSAYRSILPRAVGTVTIRVGTIIGFPSASGDTYAVLENGELAVGGPGLLANDQPGYRSPGAPSPRLTAAIHDAPSHGTVALNADGTFTYRPNPGFVGVDEFRYAVTDATTNELRPDYFAYYHPDLGIVRIYVTPVAPPLAIGDQYYSAIVDQPFDSGPSGVLVNDIGAGRPLQATLITNPRHGTLTFRADGTFSYVPNPGFEGTDTFTYRATDSATPDGQLDSDLAGFSNVATVSIYVQPSSPTPIPRDDSFSTAQSAPLDENVLSNDFLYRLTPPAGFTCFTTGVYIPSPTFVVTLLSGPSHGTLTLRENGEFHYTPEAGFVGQDKFKYSLHVEYREFALNLNGVDDSGSSAEATIDVQAIDHVPLARDDNYSANGEPTLFVTAAAGLMANDAAVTSTTTVMLVSPPLHGTLLLSRDGSFTYIPFDGVFRDDSFSYRLRETAVTDGRPFLSNIAKVFLVPLSTNSSVGAVDDRFNTPEGTPLHIPAGGVLENDFVLPTLGAITYPFTQNPCGYNIWQGPPAQTRLLTTLISGPAHGTLTLNPDGSFDYTPESGFTGIDTFIYQANAEVGGEPSIIILGHPSNSSPPRPLPHDMATVVIVVQPTDAQPHFFVRRQHAATDESGPQKISGWAAPAMIAPGNQNAPSYEVTNDHPELFSQPPTIDATGHLIYTPAPNIQGTAEVKVRLIGGATTEEQTQSFTITITKPHPLHNTASPRDVSRDNGIAPGDALLVINYLNSPGGQPAAEPNTAPYYDVSGDGQISPLDALLVIDYLNDPLLASAEGESAAADFSPATSSAPTGSQLSLADTISLLAQDSAAEMQRRRRLS